MSSRMLHRWLLRTKSSPSFLRSTGPGPMSSGLTSTMNTIRFPAQHSGGAVLQQRHFHQTRSRWLFSGFKIAGILAFCSIGGLGINSVVEFERGGTIPPHTWARTVDQQRLEEVETALAAGFEIARRGAPDQQNDALREATFQVPHELARLNKDAPDFRLEDLGPMVYAKKGWEKTGEALPRFAPFIDCAEETRVFLYFPNGAAKATAVFVAVNHELDYPLRRPQPSAQGYAGMVMRAVHAAIDTGLVVGAFQCEMWARSQPRMTERMTDRIEEMERLPIIFNFREKAFGARYYTRFEYVDRIMCVTPLTTTGFGSRNLESSDAALGCLNHG